MVIKILPRVLDNMCIEYAHAAGRDDRQTIESIQRRARFIAFASELETREAILLDDLMATCRRWLGRTPTQRGA